MLLFERGAEVGREAMDKASSDLRWRGLDRFLEVGEPKMEGIVIFAMSVSKEWREVFLSGKVKRKRCSFQQTFLSQL